MAGFFVAGKAFCVCEDLKQLAEENKGKTVADLMRERRAERLKRTIDEQLNSVVREYENEKRNNK